jgi:hypothetical protein
MAITMTELDHFRADGVDLAIKLVAQFIDPVEATGERLMVAAVEQRQDARDLLVEVNAGIVDQIGKAGLQPHQRGRVVELAPLLDQAINQCARRFAFLFRRFAIGVETLADGGEPLGVGGRLDFLDDHAAQRHRALERVDVGPRQRAIGRNVAPRQIVEPLTDLHHERRRYQRRDGHQDDERHRDSDDFALDRQSDHRAIHVAAAPKTVSETFFGIRPAKSITN